MEIHSNPPILYYGFKFVLLRKKCKRLMKPHSNPPILLYTMALTMLFHFSQLLFQEITRFAVCMDKMASITDRSHYQKEVWLCWGNVIELYTIILPRNCTFCVHMGEVAFMINRQASYAVRHGGRRLHAEFELLRSERAKIRYYHECIMHALWCFLISMWKQLRLKNQQ